MTNDELIGELINKYREAHPLYGMQILEKIEKLMPKDADIIKDGNCCSYRQIVSGLLFND